MVYHHEGRPCNIERIKSIPELQNFIENVFNEHLKKDPSILKPHACQSNALFVHLLGHRYGLPVGYSEGKLCNFISGLEELGSLKQFNGGVYYQLFPHVWNTWDGVPFDLTAETYFPDYIPSYVHEEFAWTNDSFEMLKETKDGKRLAYYNYCLKNKIWYADDFRLDTPKRGKSKKVA